MKTLEIIINTEFKMLTRYPNRVKIQCTSRNLFITVFLNEMVSIKLHSKRKSKSTRRNVHLKSNRVLLVESNVLGRIRGNIFIWRLRWTKNQHIKIP